ARAVTAAPRVAADRPAGWIRRRWTGTTLRGRLLVALIALLALICLIVGSVTVLVLQRALIGQVDDRLHAAVFRPGDGDPSNLHPRGRESGDPPAGAFGPPEGSLYGDARQSVAVFDDGGYKVLTASQLAALNTVARDGRPHTVDLPGLGDFRVIM